MRRPQGAGSHAKASVKLIYRNMCRVIIETRYAHLFVTPCIYSICSQGRMLYATEAQKIKRSALLSIQSAHSTSASIPCTHATPRSNQTTPCILVGDGVGFFNRIPHPSTSEQTANEQNPSQKPSHTEQHIKQPATYHAGLVSELSPLLPLPSQLSLSLSLSN